MFTKAAKSFTDCLDAKKLKGKDAFVNLKLKGKHGLDARVFAQLGRKSDPGWMKFFSPHVTFPRSVKNTMNSLVFLIQQGKRYFAVTTGYGHTAINHACMEPDFGLRVTLNCIDPDGIKGVDARRIDNRASQKRLLLSKEGGIGDFEFDLDEDLLRMVSGQVIATKNKLGTKMVGSDSLSLTIPKITLPQLGVKCDELWAAFDNKDYETHFKFIDQLRLVKEPGLIAKLDAEVEKRFKARKTDLLLAYPEIEFWQKDVAYRVSSDGEKRQIDDVTLDAVYAFLTDFDLKDATPDSVWITGVKDDGEPATRRRPVYDYIVCEVDLGGERYLLSAKKWYRLAKDFVAEIETAMDRIKELGNTGLVPTKPKEKEGDYNLRAANANLVCLDKKNFRKLPGRSQVEICDLMSRKGQLFAVKRYNGSATLSHLFSQGYVSAELFRDHKPYREAVAKHVPTKWGKLFDVNKPEEAGLTFVYAIAGSPPGKVAKSLPFFSKVNLRYFSRAIERLGYKVMVARIPVQ
ncbi:MAG: TIGR04141 family sporadically distributed protein [Planctomycetes bacterium]|nr:TIGR04141 family sporadically distributed protein [Planctomycetota bacterium]